MEVLGIDIGGTGIKGAVVNTITGTLVTEKKRIPTPNEGRPNDIADVIAELVNHFNWKGKVGCGFPTVISHGKALFSSNLHKSWKDLNIEQLFNKRTGLDFTIVNDADAAGLAEMHFGIGKGKQGLVLMITIGTGLGSGAFYNGHLIPNFELGTIPYKKYTKIEDWAADSARKREELTYEIWGKRFNKFLKIVERLFSPDYILIGGGASKKLYKFEHFITIQTPIIAAQFENNAGIVGAALSVEEESIH